MIQWYTFEYNGKSNFCLFQRINFHQVVYWLCKNNKYGHDKKPPLSRLNGK